MQEGTRISWTLLLLMVVDFCVTMLRKSYIVSLLCMEVKTSINSKGTDKLLKPFQTAFMKQNVDLLRSSHMPYIPQHITCRLVIIKLCSVNEILYL